MTGYQRGGAAGQNIFKIATAIALVLVFSVVYVIQKEMKATGGSASSYIKPVEPEVPEVRKLPPPAEPRPAPPQASSDILPNAEAPAPRIANAPVLPALPKTPVRSSAPAPTREIAPGVQMLAVPVTEVHPLSDAEEVMGAPSGEAGEIGVTRTFNLPEDDGQNETYPPPND